MPAMNPLRLDALKLKWGLKSDKTLLTFTECSPFACYETSI